MVKGWHIFKAGFGILSQWSCRHCGVIREGTEGKRPAAGDECKAAGKFPELLDHSHRDC